MLTINLVYVIIIGCLIIFGKARYDFLKASKHYNIVKKRDNWVVRDKRGRFVRITDNYWDVCTLGAEL